MEEKAQLVLRIDTTFKETEVEAEATLNMGAGAGEVRGKVRATEEAMLQKKARCQQQKQKSKARQFTRSRRSSYHKMTMMTMTPRSASFAPHQFSIPPSLPAITDHATFAPFECALCTRQRLAPTVEPSPIMLS